MKTIAELAKEMNVSVQTIYRRLNSIKQFNNASLTEKKSGVSYITDKGEEMLKDSLQAFKQSSEQDNKVSSENSEVAYLREQNNLLHNELKIEREHSRQQSDKLSDLSKQLAELTLNTQILLKQEQEKNEFLLPPKPKAVSADTKPEDEIGQDTEKERRRFWPFWKKNK